MTNDNINDFQKIIKYNRELNAKYINLPKYKIKILSNVIVNQLKDILEYFLRVEGIPAEVNFGDFDNIVQDSKKCSEDNAVIIFWEINNLINL